MSEIYTTEQLIRYLDGEMNQEEQSQWDLRIAADTDLQDQLHHLKLAKEAVQLTGTSAKVKRIHEAFVQQAPVTEQPAAVVTRMYSRTWMRVAAAVTILILLSAGWWLSQTTNNAIVADHFVDFSVSNSRNQGSLSAIEQAYSGKQYDQVLELATAGSIQGKDSLLTGIAYLQSKKYGEAIQWLTSMQSSQPFREDAEYYLAFAWLGKKDDKKAVQILESIHQNPAHLYHAAVSNGLLQKLKYRL
jgi:GR25 family glycosyltransferase involved in LPS biosynthesis